MINKKFQTKKSIENITKCYSDVSIEYDGDQHHPDHSPYTIRFYKSGSSFFLQAKTLDDLKVKVDQIINVTDELFDEMQKCLKQIE